MRIAILSGLLLSAAALAEAPTPMGGEFQVNSYTTSYQQTPAVAVAPSGGGASGHFVVVWASDGSAGSDHSGFSVQGQRFAPDDSSQGQELQINAYTTAGQVGPAVAMAPNGDFVVVWSSVGPAGSDASGASIQGQLFASDGSLVGGQFQVNTYTTDLQYYPAVGMAADGDFVVAWASDTSSSSFFDLRAQRFAGDGSPRGGELRVNSYDPGAQQAPAVAMARSGDFLVVWGNDGSNGSDTSLSSIQGQWFASDGTLLGDQFQINSYTSGNQRDPAVAVTPRGDFLVLWGSDGSNDSDTSMGSVRAQRFAGILFANGFENGDLSDWSDPIQ